MCYAATIVVCLWLIVQFPFRLERLPLYFIAPLIPFFLAGMALSMIFDLHREIASTLYFADLIGASLGALAVTSGGSGHLPGTSLHLRIIAANCRLAAGKPRKGDLILEACRLICLSCSLTSCCDWSGESPDDGRFPVRPSSLTPNAVRQRAAPKAGVTMSSEGAVKSTLTLSRCSQPGGLGKRAGRNIKRTMQPRNESTREVLLAETALRMATRLIRRESLESSCEYNRSARRTAGVGSATCMESTASESREGPAGRRGAPAQRRRCV